MQEAVALLIRPSKHVVALTQHHPGEHGEAGRVQQGFYRRPLQQRGKVQGSHELLYLRICRRHLGSKQLIDDHDHAPWP